MAIRVEIDGKGKVAEFPDGTDPAVIDAAIKRDYFSGGEQSTALQISPDVGQPPQSDTNAPLKPALETDIDGRSQTNINPKEGAKVSLLRNPPQPEKSYSLGDFALSTLSNIPVSAGKLAKDIIHPIIHPIDTAKSIGALADGATVGKLLEKWGLPEQAQAHNVDAANAAGKAISDRYGSADALLNTIRTDPVGVLADLSTFITGGGGAVRGVSKIPSLAAFGKTGEALGKVGTAIDPINAAGKAISGISNIQPVARAIEHVKRLPAEVLGITTGAGPFAVERAFKGGTEFRAGISGSLNADEIVTRARDAVSKVKEDRGNLYRERLAELEQNMQPLDFTPISQSFDRNLQKFKVGRDAEGQLEAKFSAINNKDLKDLQEIDSILSAWRNEPAQHTPSGLDTLKRRLDDFYSDSSNVRALVTDMRNKVKKTIVETVPEYAQMSKDYEHVTGLVKEFDRALSTSNKAMIDTTMRKLESTMRAPFQSRKETLGKLEDLSGADLSGAIAGNSMSKMAPRGVLGPLAAGSGIGTAAFTHNPGILALLPFTSPYLVGRSTQGAGALYNALSKIRNKLSPEQWSSIRDALMLSGRTDKNVPQKADPLGIRQ